MTEYLKAKTRYGAPFPVSYIGPGWRDLVVELDAKLYELYPNYVIGQIKEKFGGLRYYTDGFPEEVADEAYELIRQAEAKSYKICDVCGKPGELRKGGWLRTLCEDCYAAN